MTFQAAIKLIFAHEGGYVNDPDDPGGETNFGISKRQFPDLDIKNLDEARAESIYYSKYWLPMRLDEVRNDLLKLHMLDMGVNAGIVIAVALLQQIVNAQTDGKMGPITLFLTNNFKDQKDLTDSYIKARYNYYRNLIKKKPILLKYWKSWSNRVKDTTAFYKEYVSINNKT